MRTALRQNKARTRVSQPISLPAPVKGWMTAAPLIGMPAASAVLLDNWFPEADSVRPRRGSKLYIAGLGPRGVESVFGFTGTKPAVGTTPAVAPRLFAACGPTIFDITDPTKAPAQVLTGFRSARWFALNMVVSGGPQLLLFNGVDAPLRFDGTSWTQLAFTTGGIASGGTIATAVAFDGSVFTGACMYASRLYLQAGAAIYYAPADSFQGDLGVLQVGNELANGGTLAQIGRWTHDPGQGPQDTLVAVSTQGEIVVYQGTNPSNASLWSLIGKYDAAKVLGTRALVKLGGDLGILTADGVQPMSKVLTLDRANDDNAGALTANIRNAFKADAELYGALYGWQAVVHRERAMLIVNVPLAEGTAARQYVMNVQTGAWTRFTGLNAITWCSFGGSLYYGTANGQVVQADVGFGDLGQPTICPLIGAFTATKGRASLKSAKLMRAILMGNVAVPLPVGVCTDYVLALPGAQPPPAGTDAARWNSALWNVSRWASSQFGAPQQAWAAASGLGNAFAAAACLTLDASTPAAADIRLVGFDLILEEGAPLG